ncbi:alpha/beta hydrolase-fold protein [Gangjinia marincola]|uniref:Alpha/beta hydrolase-fold protein n=1 Tax=Gangjinia marincola TaxID=578463 RepID=A0ABN1MH91_9FLAO
MRNSLLLFLFISLGALAQTQYVNVESQILQSKRKIKIQLPRNYAENEDKTYPVILTLDGDYLFEILAGNVDYSSYWEDMPEAIVVGVMHENRRQKDLQYEDVNYYPDEEGALFFEFIGMEVFPYLDENYRTAKFTIALGHDQSANFINYYLMKDNPLFRGFINLSPDFAPPMPDRIADVLSNSKQKIWYYTATGTEDVNSLREDALALDQRLKEIQSEQLLYTFDNFKGANHYSLVERAIPKALESIFSVYRPIDNKEFNEKVITSDLTPYQYLMNKYQTVEDLFGLNQKVRVNDFVAIADAIEKKEAWDDYEDLGKLANQYYPKAMMGSYYKARFYEETGSPKKAMRMYQSAFLLDEIANLDKDTMLDRSEQIKEDFGY